ncbi:MAG: hypothetical protein JW765_06740 [Deltaproteobacteria bacterium]|nr:hypothetical protein [Candidatus Zymogenaceae bacterium]
MSAVGRLCRALLLSAFAMLWACHAAPPEGGEAPKAGGVFFDVLEAVGEVEQSLPKADPRDPDVPRGEWNLIDHARQRFTLPRAVYEYSTENDYYLYDDTDNTGGGDGTRGDALDVILDAEWDEYRTLSLSVSAETPDTQLLKYAQDSLADFYRDLPILMSAVPDTMRERVIHIVVLRYFNTILRAGVDPRLFTVMQPR